MPTLLKVRLSLKGRPLRTYTFDQKSIAIGRDPNCDIFLDNTGISRSHATIELTPGGYMVEDQGSANGTFLNDNPIQREYIGHNDVIQIGKFALWLGLDADRREKDLLAATAKPEAFEGTTVLSTEQMVEMQRKSRDEEAKYTPEEPVENRVSFTACLTASSACFLLGLFAGVALTILFNL